MARYTTEATARITKNNLILEAEVIRLRRATAPRRLTNEQQSRIAGKLSSYVGGTYIGGQRGVQTTLFSADQEMEQLARDLHGSLPVKAGWVTAVNSVTAAQGFSGHYGLLNNLVLQGRNPQRTLPPVGLLYIELVPFP